MVVGVLFDGIVCFNVFLVDLDYCGGRVVVVLDVDGCIVKLYDLCVMVVLVGIKDIWGILIEYGLVESVMFVVKFDVIIVVMVVDLFLLFYVVKVLVVV